MVSEHRKKRLRIGRAPDPPRLCPFMHNMPSGAVLGALSGSLIGPAFALLFHRVAGRLDAPGRDPTPRERAILIAIAAADALVVAGAVVMAGACMRSTRGLEILAAAAVPVPYAVYRVLKPCVDEYPRF